MKSNEFSSPHKKFLTRSLNGLLKLEGVYAWSLKKDGHILLSNGNSGNETFERPFHTYILTISVDSDCLTSEVERHIKSLAKLAVVIQKGMSPDSSIKSSYLIKSYLDILLLLEERIYTSNFYEEILHLNEEILLASNLFGVLQSIMDMACKACNGEGSSLLLVDKKTGEIYFNVVSGDNQTELQEIRIPAGEGIAGSVVNSSVAEIISDVVNDPRSFQRVDKVLQHTTRNMIIAPIIAHGVVIGVIEVINSNRKQGFLQEDLDFLVHIANHTSLFIENIKAKEALLTSNQTLDRKNSEINTLYEIGQALNTSLDPNDLKQKLLTALLKILSIKYASVFELSDNKLVQTFHGAEDKQVIQDLAPQINLIATTDIILWLENYKEPFLFNDKDGNMNALSVRLLEANQVVYENIPVPDLWLPIFSDDGKILFIVSLCGSQFSREAPVSDMKFFHGVMSTCYTIFRNVRSYNNAIQAKIKEEHIRKVFQKYVPATVISTLLETEDPKPVQQIVSVLFADIRGFTQLTEMLEPYKLVSLLNQYFEVMVEAITLHGGLVDKFMGDSIMATFGFPNPGKEDATNALAAAAQMQKQLKIINLDRDIAGEAPFQMGIGLHTGQVIAGNIGAQNRKDFTIIGDTVNLAARLEKAVKYYKIPMLYTGETRDQAPTIPCREIDLIKVRGRNASVHVYEPLYNVQLSQQDSHKYLEKWEKGISLYRASRFSESEIVFQEINNMNNLKDSVCEIYIERCKEMVKKSPAHFDGIFHLK